MHKNLTHKRLDVEGLRAIAVLAVLFFHLQLFDANGGFVGVDVFFVISGYVIFRNITERWIKGDFSFVSFSIKRFFRIYPALLLVILLTLLAGFFLLTTQEYTNLSVSSLMALVSASNIYYADQFDYFADSAITKPLLHSWSLAVEMQFYVLFAFILVVIPKKRRNKNLLVLILLSITLISFLANLYFCYIKNDTTKAFYLPFGRFWQMSLGALVAVWEGQSRAFNENSTSNKKTFIINNISFCTLLLLIASFWLIGENSNFPGFIILLPTLLTVCLLVVNSYNNGSISAKILKLPIFNFIGKISYSIYLLHWPIIVFLYLYQGRHLQFYEKIALVPIIIALSYLLWKFVENPFRRKNYQEFRVFLLVMALIVAMSFTVIYSKGLSVRYSDKTKEIESKINKALNEQDSLCNNKYKNNSVKKAVINSCYLNDIKNSDYILWGDSHAGMISHSLQSYMLQNKLLGYMVSMPDCNPLIGVNVQKSKNKFECEELKKFTKDIFTENQIPTIILASRWGQLSAKIRSPGDGTLPSKIFQDGKQISFDDAIFNTVKYFNDLGIKVILIGPFPEISFDVPKTMIRSSLLKQDIPITKKEDFLNRQKFTLKAFKNIEKQNLATIIYPHEILCDNNQCIVEKDGIPIYHDDDHLTGFGADKISKFIVEKINNLHKLKF